jgi:hypothetical protein
MFDPYSIPTPEEIAALTAGNKPTTYPPSSNGVGTSENEVGTSEAKVGGKPGPKPQYPWDEWLDGEYHVLVRHRDFPRHSRVSFSQMVRNTAAKREGVAWIEMLELEQMGVQFFRTRVARLTAKYKAKGNDEGLWHGVDEE